MEFIETDILKLLPQRPPFVMVDRLTGIDERTTTAEFTVRPDCIFVEENALLAEGLMECIAQTCAARIGYINVYNNQPVKIGFIGAVRDYEIVRPARVGETVTITVTVVEEVFGMILASAAVCVGDETIARTDMKIALSDSEPEDNA